MHKDDGHSTMHSSFYLDHFVPLRPDLSAMVSVNDGVPMVLVRDWRRALYAISLVLALLELITEAIAQQKDEWVLPWVA